MKTVTKLAMGYPICLLSRSIFPRVSAALRATPFTIFLGIRNAAVYRLEPRPPFLALTGVTSDLCALSLL